jgi:crotonobetainyl-CoA:carnitine CoA-transferase CaiB-like acyl-CoA transferase
MVALAGPISGLTVYDASWGMTGSVATLLLAEFGARVVKVERPGGGPDAGRTARKAWDRGKWSVEVDLTTDAGLECLGDLLGGADVFVESFPRTHPAAARFSRAVTGALNPGLIHCTISGYGPSGPWRDRPAYDALVAARMGFMAEQPGHRPGPIFLGHPSVGYTAGFLAAIGILAALRARHVTGAGQGVDVSLLDGVLGQAPMNWWFTEKEASYLSTPEKGHFGHRRLLLDMFRCADGEYLMVHSGGQGSFKALMDVLGVGDRFREIHGESEMGAPLDDDEFHVARQVVPTLWASRPRAEWLAMLAARDIAAVPVLRPGEVLAHEQVREAGLTVEIDDPDLGRVRQVGPPIRFSATPAAVPGPAPRVGEHNDRLGSLRATTSAVTPGGGHALLRHALEGIRVLDFSVFFAGAYGAKLLSDLGADVIKVESVEGDPMRPLPDPFEGCQRGKRTIALNLRTEEGRAVAHRLVAGADVVIHNLRPGKAERLGIDYDTLRAIRPDLIYCHQPGWGEHGPHAGQKSFAPLMSALTGLMHMAAGAGNPPVRRARASEDYYGGFLGAVGVLMALAHRDATGEGQRLEASQLCASLFAVIEQFVDPSGRLLADTDLDQEQLGVDPLHRLFRCADGWVCVACVGERATSRLAGALAGEGIVTVPTDERPARLEAELAGRLETMAAADAFAFLDGHRVPCEIVAEAPYMPDFFWQDWAVEAGKVFVHQDHPVWGYIREVGQVIGLTRTPGPTRGPGPLLGEHTREILGELGYTPGETDKLVLSGVVFSQERGGVEIGSSPCN